MSRNHRVPPSRKPRTDPVRDALARGWAAALDHGYQAHKRLAGADAVTINEFLDTVNEIVAERAADHSQAPT